MKKYLFISILFYTLTIMCFVPFLTAQEKQRSDKPIEERLKVYAPVQIVTDLSEFEPEKQELIRLLVKAGQVADEIFWIQSAPDAIAVRDSLEKIKIKVPKKKVEEIQKEGKTTREISMGDTIAFNMELMDPKVVQQRYSGNVTLDVEVPPKKTIEDYKNQKITVEPYKIDNLDTTHKVTSKTFTQKIAEEEAQKTKKSAETKIEEDTLLPSPYYLYTKINYGPYDVLNDNERFVGKGPDFRPPGGNFYPIDMTKEEFEHYILSQPELKEAFESQYTIIVRDETRKLRAVPYSKAYHFEILRLSKLLKEASEKTSDPNFKRYLELRAEDLLKDDYYESDMAWMDVRDYDIDVIIGPIENYEDGLFNYKTAFEAIVMIKDREATNELEMFKSHIQDFENNLPIDKKYIRTNIPLDNSQLNIVNVVYFGGDCQKGVKTIASSLPNDPRVREQKGGKNNMFKNMMEAKFEKIVIPIANELIDSDWLKYVDAKAFTTFVTLHEVSHTLGREYVYGIDTLTVRKALKERYSPIEECKADILSMYNHFYLYNIKVYDKEYIRKAMATYIAGLYRSIRFGAESAHGLANLIQLNFLREKGAIIKTKNGKYIPNEQVFFNAVKELATLILETEITGNYDKAGEILFKYARMTEEIQNDIKKLTNIPRDIDVEYVIK